ncbi:MAG: ACT domain-containing protein [Planctomycetota bacterium]|nr:ACT domain-containing protein [Planctomycetota bacterium]
MQQVQKESILISASRRDQPGIVDRVSGAIFDAGANLEDSRMAILGGEFALFVLVGGTTEQLAAVRAGLDEVSGELDLTLQVKPVAAAQPGADVIDYRLQAVSLDHPGIVHRLTGLLRTRGVNVASLETSLAQAPITGTPIFSLDMEVQVPVDQPVNELREELQRLAAEENIDVTFLPAS